MPRLSPLVLLALFPLTLGYDCASPEFRESKFRECTDYSQPNFPSKCNGEVVLAIDMGEDLTFDQLTKNFVRSIPLNGGGAYKVGIIAFGMRIAKPTLPLSDSYANICMQLSYLNCVAAYRGNFSYDLNEVLNTYTQRFVNSENYDANRTLVFFTGLTDKRNDLIKAALPAAFNLKENGTVIAVVSISRAEDDVESANFEEFVSGDAGEEKWLPIAESMLEDNSTVLPMDQFICDSINSVPTTNDTDVREETPCPRTYSNIFLDVVVVMQTAANTAMNDDILLQIKSNLSTKSCIEFEDQLFGIRRNGTQDNSDTGLINALKEANNILFDTNQGARNPTLFRKIIIVLSSTLNFESDAWDIAAHLRANGIHIATINSDPDSSHPHISAIADDGLDFDLKDRGTIISGILDKFAELSCFCPDTYHWSQFIHAIGEKRVPYSSCVTVDELSPATVKTAIMACSRLGGFLVSIQSPAKQDFVLHDLMGRVGDETILTKGIWLGLKRDGNEFIWDKSDTHPALNWTNFAEPQPQPIEGNDYFYLQCPQGWKYDGNHTAVDCKWHTMSESDAESIDNDRHHFFICEQRACDTEKFERCVT